MTEWKIERTPYESEIDIVSDGRTIATVEAGEDKEEIASLIAAAPEMLEALEGAKWLIESYVSDLENSEEYRDICRVMKKARDEE